MLDWMKPIPSYKNVIPNGNGWYKFYNGKWRKSKADDNAIYLAEYELTEFAIKAAKALKRKIT